MGKHDTSFLRGLGYPVQKPDLADEVLYGVVWLANQTQRQVAKTLKPYGLAPVKLNYLMVVKHVGGEKGISQREIASRLLIDPGNVAHVLDNLEKKGWVVRSPGPDRRSHRIKVTPEGNRLLDKVWPVYDGVMKSMTASLTKADQQQLIKILGLWRDKLGQ